jgi:hypothetical protein
MALKLEQLDVCFVLDFMCKKADITWSIGLRINVKTLILGMESLARKVFKLPGPGTPDEISQEITCLFFVVNTFRKSSDTLNSLQLHKGAVGINSFLLSQQRKHCAKVDPPVLGIWR